MKHNRIFIKPTELWKSNLWAIEFSSGCILFPAEMKTKGHRHSSAGEEGISRRVRQGRRVLPVWKWKLVIHSTRMIYLPMGLTEPNQQSFQIALNRPKRDKSNWSPCLHSLSLTASCHSNKLDCCRMRPIKCDVRRACQVPCARCNCEHQ